MGMSASQARLLMLTARKSDLEYQAQQICQQKLALAQQEEVIATEYNNAISNTQYNIVTRTSEGQGTIDLTFANLRDAGYWLQDVNDNIVFPDKESWEEYNAEHPDNKVNEPTIYYPAVAKDGGGAESYIKYMLESEMFSLYKVKTEDGEKEAFQTNVSMEATLSETYDTSDDAAAEATYDLETKKIQTKEKKLDLSLEQIETQHEAVKNEIEAVEKVVKDNVEASFKTFSA